MTFQGLKSSDNATFELAFCEFAVLIIMNEFFRRYPATPMPHYPRCKLECSRRTWQYGIVETFGGARISRNGEEWEKSRFYAVGSLKLLHNRGLLFRTS